MMPDDDCNVAASWEGPLEKAGKSMIGMGAWRQRWCMIDQQGQFRYWEDHTKTNFLGSVPLEKACWEFEAGSGSGKGSYGQMSIRTVGRADKAGEEGGRAFHFRFLPETNRESVCGALARAHYLRNRDVFLEACANGDAHTVLQVLAKMRQQESLSGGASVGRRLLAPAPAVRPPARSLLLRLRPREHHGQSRATSTPRAVVVGGSTSTRTTRAPWTCCCTRPTPTATAACTSRFFRPTDRPGATTNRGATPLLRPRTALPQLLRLLRPPPTEMEAMEPRSRSRSRSGSSGVAVASARLRTAPHRDAPGAALPRPPGVQGAMGGQGRRRQRRGRGWGGGDGPAGDGAGARAGGRGAEH